MELLYFAFHHFYGDLEPREKDLEEILIRCAILQEDIVVNIPLNQVQSTNKNQGFKAKGRQLIFC